MTRFFHACLGFWCVALYARAQAPDAVKPPWISRPGSALAQGTGFFRTFETRDGRWWLLDPEGKPFFNVGTDHINYQGLSCEKLGYAPYHRNVVAKYGSEAAWDQMTIRRLKEWGFTTLTGDHSVSLQNHGLPYTMSAAFGAHFAPREWIGNPGRGAGFPDVFSPQWQPYCRSVALRLARQCHDDPWCVGTFLDNELHWYGTDGNLADQVFGDPPRAAAKNALYQWLLQRFHNLDGLNRSLQTHYAGEADFLNSTNLPPPSAALDQVRDDFLAVIADRYFRVGAGALRAVDPEHLVLGCRFAGRAPEPVLAAAGKYCDVCTINLYPRVDFLNAWLPDGTGATVEGVLRQLADYYAVTRKPVIVTEWSFPALDSGLPCKRGAGMRVDTQAQRAECYRIFADAMANLPFLVGYDYFMWQDEPAQGISASFPEDSNYGLVNVHDDPYETLVTMAARVNRAAATVHAQSRPPGCLQMKSESDAVVFGNTNSVPVHAVLRIIVNGRARIGQMNLMPGEIRRLPMPPDKAWCAELWNWDTTRPRVVGGAIRPGSVVNASADTLDNLPVVMDDGQVTAARVRELKPGESLQLPRPAGPFAPVKDLECRSATVTWSCSGKNGELFDSIAADGLPIGSLVFALHEQVAEQDEWAVPDKLVQLEKAELPDAWVAEWLVSRAPAKTGPAGYQACVRVVVFKKLDSIFVRPVWIANADARGWKLTDAFVLCRPAIGGSPADNVLIGPGVPGYYRDTHSFTNTRLGGCFGAFSQEGWDVHFWKDGTGHIHPDCRYPVNENLAPGARWKADPMAWLLVYASKDANAWKALSRKNREANDALVARDP